MIKAKIIKHIKGYIIGFAVFIILIPILIYGISQVGYYSSHIKLFDSRLIKNIISTSFFSIGLIFVVWSNIYLFIIGQGGPADVFNIAISPRSKKLVVAGPYRFTRNPMVFGMNSIYFSIATYLNSLIALIFVVFFFLVIIIYIKLTEEKRLLNDFGEEYLEYKRKVSMIIPFLPKQSKNQKN